MLRKIEEESPVREKLKKLKEDQKFALAYDAFKWLLERANIERGEMVTKTYKGLRVYKQAGDQQAGTPAIIVMYFSLPQENKAVIIDVEVGEDAANTTLNPPPTSSSEQMDVSGPARL